MIYIYTYIFHSTPTFLLPCLALIVASNSNFRTAVEVLCSGESAKSAADLSETLEIRKRDRQGPVCRPKSKWIPPFFWSNYSDLKHEFWAPKWW